MTSAEILPRAPTSRPCCRAQARIVPASVRALPGAGVLTVAARAAFRACAGATSGGAAREGCRKARTVAAGEGDAVTDAKGLAVGPVVRQRPADLAEAICAGRRRLVEHVEHDALVDVEEVSQGEQLRPPGAGDQAVVDGVACQGGEEGQVRASPSAECASHSRIPEAQQQSASRRRERSGR